jgi:hypothetical protein
MIAPVLTNIRIGPLDYGVSYLARPIDEGEICWGYVKHGARAIVVDSELCAQRTLVTLWHETLHALLDQTGLVPQGEEALCNALAHGIVQVLRDNPPMRQGGEPA